MHFKMANAVVPGTGFPGLVVVSAASRLPPPAVVIPIAVALMFVNILLYKYTFTYPWQCENCKLRRQAEESREKVGTWWNDAEEEMIWSMEESPVDDSDEEE